MTLIIRLANEELKYFSILKRFHLVPRPMLFLGQVWIHLAPRRQKCR